MPGAAEDATRDFAAASSDFSKFVREAIASDKVVVFSKSYCPYSIRAKSLLTRVGVKAKVYELDQLENGLEIQAALTDISGLRTVPQVFIGQRLVGGSDATTAEYENGELKRKLEGVGIQMKEIPRST